MWKLCCWSRPSAILSSQHSLSSLGFFFTPILCKFRLTGLSMCLPRFIAYSTFPGLSPGHPSDDLFFFKSSHVSAICLPPPGIQTLALASHARLLVLTSHSNAASGNSPERGEGSLEQLPTSFPHLISHTPPPFLSLISEVIYFPG